MNPVKFSIHKKLKICVPLLASLAFGTLPITAHAGLTFVIKCLDSKGKPLYSDSSAAARAVCSADQLIPSVKVQTPAVTPAVETKPASTAGKVVTDSVFSSTSFWYTPIPRYVNLHANTEAMKQDFLRQRKQYYGTVNIATQEYSSPVFTVGKDVKPVKVSWNNCAKKSWIDPSWLEQMAAVPIPSYALQSKGSDGEMTIYQPSTDTIWELWKAGKDEKGNWNACWGGRMQNASKSNGVFTSYYGTTATSLPFLGGQITKEELDRGEIKHAIGIALVDLAAYNIFSWPANRSDGNARGIIPEGTRFRLDPTVDVEKLNLTRAGKTIAKAAQVYGFVVWDKAGAITMRAQNEISYKAEGIATPYKDHWTGNSTWPVLQNFPWDKLQFLPMNYGKF